ncbi:MAG: pitrilysin family protein [Aestuariivita sp.]|nr:pitrilysin family protein [Aestuariivita sp.]MCY4204058.1 pitrilysin family protein [Aestuariivita sp.]MCY4290084.1 pitrilysin family protein [Aestuariivita sp.]MCY4347980.1 pitrilysin family protein [Aestuariivita sp.]
MSIRLSELSNGLRVVSEHMPSLKSTALGIWVTAGGRHERPEQNGIAHFLEHMAFKGTKSRSAFQIAKAIEDVGGYINAYTSREVTAFFARVLEDDVQLAIDVLADILLNPIFDPKEIEVERGVILQEIGQALDTPDDVIFDWLQERSFSDQPMGRTILGRAEQVQAFTRNDLTNFVYEHYAPSQMIIAAAGSLDHAGILEMAEQLFGKLPARNRSVVEPATFTGGEARQEKDLEQAHFALAFESPGIRDDDLYRAQIYTTALGGGMSSRLFQEVRERRGLCYSIFAQSGAYIDTGTTTIYAGTSAEQVHELAQIVINELKRAASDLSDDEVSRARNQLKAGTLIALESPSARAERLARLVHVWDRVPSLDETIAQIDAVTTDDVRAHAAQLAHSEKMALALYGPIKTAPTLETVQEWRRA